MLRRIELPPVLYVLFAMTLPSDDVVKALLRLPPYYEDVQFTESFGRNDCLSNAMLCCLSYSGALRQLSLEERDDICRNARIALCSHPDKSVRPQNHHRFYTTIWRQEIYHHVDLLNRVE